MQSFTTNRRTVIKLGIQIGAAAGLVSNLGIDAASAQDGKQLIPPKKGRIPVAVLLSKGAVVIDFAGPWEVFQDARDFSRGDEINEVVSFYPYTVAAAMDPILASGGLTVVPNFTFETAPPPRVIVVPAQSAGDVELAWLRKTSATVDLTMSVCTGALVLARTGLLDGRSATTHHSAVESLAKQFPKIKVERNVRYVDNGTIATSAGLSAGIDLALHVVRRYFGKDTAVQTAKQMEYHGHWQSASLDATNSHEHAKEKPASDVTTTAGFVCPPCGCAADGRVFAKPGACPACGMPLIKKG